MEKVILAVGDKVADRHCRVARNLIAVQAHVPKQVSVSVDDLMISDIELERLHGDGTSLFSSTLSDGYYMELARKHLEPYGFIASVVFDEQSYYYCKNSSVNKYLVSRQPIVRYWLVRSDGCAVPV